ncbi:MAG: hypothetical protein NZ519_11145 [Bacteroidia bacterium]|nr:hypothetical protein [Bacteroidia bacterium]MDW8302334.1 hypothetical protein [Bacteroidia bacterium]
MQRIITQEVTFLFFWRALVGFAPQGRRTADYVRNAPPLRSKGHV